MAYLNIEQDHLSHSPSFDCIQMATDFGGPNSASLGGGTDSSGSDSEAPFAGTTDGRAARQSSGRSSASSTRSSLDYNSLRRNHVPNFYLMDSSSSDKDSNSSSLTRRSSDGAIKDRKFFALRMDSDMLKEEVDREEGVAGEWERRLDMVTRRKRDKTTGEKGKLTGRG